MTDRRLELQRPLVSFDLETTGLNPREDRVVEISCVKIHPNGDRDIKTRRLNPERPISPGATEVHGIRDEDVADCPTFRQVANSLHELLSDCDLTGFNLTRFDLPMLTAEFERCDLEFPASDVHIVDTMKIYVLKEPRTLATACEKYCDRQLTDAHSAEADAVASADILEAQLRYYPDLPVGIEALEEFCYPERVDWFDAEGKLIWFDGRLGLGFGKYRSHALEQLAQSDRGYLEWIVRGEFSREVKDAVKDALEGQFPTRAPR